MADDPDLEELYALTQRVDTVLGAEFRDVPVPEGLRERLLDRLDCDAQQAITPQATPAVVAARARRVSRRWLVAGSVALTAAAGLLIAGWMGLYSRQPDNKETILARAIESFTEGLHTAEVEGQLLTVATPSGNYPLSRAVAYSPTTRWLPLRDFSGRSGVAYRMTHRGVRGTLYVLSGPLAGLPSRPPIRPAFTTAGCAASLWNEGGRMYVLVVHSGNAATYQSFLARRGPLT